MPRREEADQAAGGYDFTTQVGYLLRRAYQRHLAVFQAEAGDNQLTSVQFSTLCALRDNGPLSQSELVQATGIDQATIRGIVDRLRGRNFVTLTRNRHDARKLVIALAAPGLAVLDDMIPRAERITELTLEHLNPAERLALLYTLRRLAALDAP